jgi:hypothetical protein
MNPATYNYQMDQRPPEDLAGNLAAKYEYITPSALIVHLCQGIHFQAIPSSNSRELVAFNVAAKYQGIFGIGSGKGSPYYSWCIQWQQLVSLSLLYQGVGPLRSLSAKVPTASPSSAHLRRK